MIMAPIHFTTSKRGAAKRRLRKSARSTERQRHSDERALAMRRFGANGTLVQRHDLPALNAFIEHSLTLIIRDSRSTILDRHFRHLIRTGKRYADLTVFGRKLHCIAQDVPEHQGQAIAFAPYEWARFWCRQT